MPRGAAGVGASLLRAQGSGFVDFLERAQRVTRLKLIVQNRRFLLLTEKGHGSISWTSTSTRGPDRSPVANGPSSP